MEAFTCLLIFKNIFSFGLTFGAYGWLTQGGIQRIFIIIESVQVGLQKGGPFFVLMEIARRYSGEKESSVLQPS